jgi:cell division transport system ATP-binding protein
MLRFETVGLRYDREGGTRRGAATGPEVLHDISFHVPAGAFRWLLGPSGAGKSSMLRLLYLSVRPTSGRLSLLGTDVTAAPRRALPALRRRIGVVFQDFRLLPHLSTFDNVALPLRIAGRPEGQIRADVTELLRWVGLSQYLDTRPAALSGGEQQRVAIARAVITRPALLLADEPTGNLDDGQAERLMQLFKEMNRIGTTVIVATHNEALVARHPARALRLAEGRLAGIERYAGSAPEMAPEIGTGWVEVLAAGGTQDGWTDLRGTADPVGGPEADGQVGWAGPADGSRGADRGGRRARGIETERGTAPGGDRFEDGDP